MKLLDATDQKAILDDVVVELPSSWTGCGALPVKKMPIKAIDIIVDDTIESTRTLQHQGCGLRGHSMILSSNVLGYGPSLRNTGRCQQQLH
jgi:hypothetical protein